jgi:hypothetical protein
MLVGEVVLDVFLSFKWAAILYEQLFIFPLVKQKRIVQYLQQIIVGAANVM